MSIEIVVYLIGLIFGLFLFVVSRGFPPASQAGLPGAAFFPGIVSTVIIGLSLILLVTALIKRWKTRSTGGETQASTEQSKFARKQAFRVIGVVLLIFLYALLWGLNIGNFLINSIVIFIPISMLYGGARERKWWKTVIFVVVLIVLTYILFTTFLRVSI